MQYAVWFVYARLPISRRSRGNIDGPPTYYCLPKVTVKKYYVLSVKGKKAENKPESSNFCSIAERLFAGDW